MRVRPILNRVLVEAIDEPEKTRGGIFIPGTVKDAPERGRVLAAGPGRHNADGVLIPVVVKPGDEVIFQKHQFVEVTVGETRYLVMNDDDILAVIA